MIRSLIVDDEVVFSDYLQSLLSEMPTEIEVVAVVDNIPDAMRAIESTKPQLVFLDMEMPEISGIDFLNRVQNRNYQIIVTTSHKDYALQAIKGEVVDYLIKPINKLDLLMAVQKAKRKIDSLQSTESNDKISVYIDNGFSFISKSDILFCRADNNYAHIYKKDGKTILVSKTLKELELQIGDQHFFRVNKSYLVNINHIKRYIKSDGGSIVMENDTEISVSPSSKEELVSRLHLKS